MAAPPALPDTPKTDWTTGGLTNGDMDRLEGNTQEMKDRIDDHAARTDTHDTIAEVRTSTSTLLLENRTSDIGSPAVGRIWLRTDL